MYSCSNYYTYTTGIQAKNKATSSLLISISNESGCFERVGLKVIDHSTGSRIVLQDESIPVKRCHDQLVQVPLNDVYYGNDMNITFYEIQICLPESGCIMVTIYELDSQQQIIPSQTINQTQLRPVCCQY